MTSGSELLDGQYDFPSLPLKTGDFPADQLPQIIKGAVMEACLNDNVAPEIAFQSAMAMVSLVCQDRLIVRRLNGVESVCSLYMLTIAGSGARKTQVDNLFSATVADYDARKKREFDLACEEYRWALEEQKDQERILRGMRKNFLRKQLTSTYEAAIDDAVSAKAVERNRRQKALERTHDALDEARDPSESSKILMVEREPGSKKFIPDENSPEADEPLSAEEILKIQIQTIDNDLNKIKEWHAGNPAPRLFRLLYSDISPSTLERRLQESWPSAALISNEAGDILNSKTISHLSNLDRLWEGKSIDVERSQKQDSVSVANPRLTLSLMIQPAVFDHFLERKGPQARGIGFLARTLICKPTPNYGEREIRKEGGRQTVWKKRFEARIQGLLERMSADFNLRAEDKNTLLSFAPDAQLLWEQDYAENEKLLGRDSKFIHDADFYSRYSEHVARMAALFYYFDSGRFEDDEFDEKSFSNEIPLPAVRSAIAVCQWYRAQFSELFNPQIILERNGELVAAELLRMLLDKQVDAIPLVALQRNVKAHLRKKAAFEPVIDWLHATGRIKVWPRPNPDTGRHIECIHFTDQAPEHLRLIRGLPGRHSHSSLAGGPKQNY